MSCYEDGMHRNSHRSLHLVRPKHRNWERELYRDITRELSRHRERNRTMRITVPDASHVNWEKVAETIREQITSKVLEVLGQMQEALADLKPGERRTIQIKVGSVTVAKPK
jgi:hypothetical protein